jgi:ABC-type multidrug transport system ATPase subunit
MEKAPLMKNNISLTTALPPMQIKLVNTGKRYNREWIFRKFNGYFETGSSYAITGNNGSGKSTLLQIISGAILKSEGEAIYTRAEKQIPEEEIHSQFSIAAPYLELIEEMTALELLQFHQSFVALTLPADEILHTVDLSASAQKQIRYYSSGMKQRLKLGIAFFSHTPALLLDEPTSNLDANGIALYHQLIKKNSAGRIVIISSNDINEYEFCNNVLKMEDYKEAGAGLSTKY